MELALYCPKFGYYERQDGPIGRRGDFFTSVSVGSLFGELLAMRFSEWLDSTAGGGRQILEAGSHDGQLAADILQWLLKHRRDLYEALEYWILEPSGHRRTAQEKTLRDFAGKVRWFESWDALPASGVRGIIFSNELLDALPVRRLGWDATTKQWFEWGVALSGSDFVWTKLPADDELIAKTNRWHLPSELLELLPDKFTTEFCQAASNWWSRAASSLKQGKLLAFDYGLEQEDFFRPERKDGTLRAYYRHHLNTDLLARPGEQDITVQVNFTAIREAGEERGLTTESMEMQARFLTEILRAASQKNPEYVKFTSQQARAFQTLTHPEHLGRSFRVLVQQW
jgi:SAM-dependent MidA family methyltransferase